MLGVDRAELGRRCPAPRAAARAARRRAAAARRPRRRAWMSKQQRARGVGGVGDVHAAAGQPPDQQAVDGAEGELAALGASRAPGDVVEQPGDLGGGEIGIEQQPGAFARPAPRRPRAQPLRKRRRCGGPARRWRCGSAGRCARSQTSVVSRWLVMPIAASRCAEQPAVRAPRAASPSVVRQISSGSCSTQPGAGKCCGNSCCATATASPRRAEDDGARRGRALIDHQNVRSHPALPVVRPRPERAARQRDRQ